MAGATEECNEKHLEPWSRACSRDGISNTPLSPYLDRELLYNNHLRIDGSKIEKTGFSYSIPQPTKELLQEVGREHTRNDDLLAMGYHFEMSSCPLCMWGKKPILIAFHKVS